MPEVSVSVKAEFFLQMHRMFVCSVQFKLLGRLKVPQKWQGDDKPIKNGKPLLALSPKQVPSLKASTKLEHVDLHRSQLARKVHLHSTGSRWLLSSVLVGNQSAAMPHHPLAAMAGLELDNLKCTLL